MDWKNGAKRAITFLGSTAQETFVEFVEKQRDLSAEDAVKKNFELTVAALAEATKKDEEIYRLLQKYWGISRIDAVRFLSDERMFLGAARNLEEYLVAYKEFSTEAAYEYTHSASVIEALRSESELRTLRPEDLFSRLETMLR